MYKKLFWILLDEIKFKIDKILFKVGRRCNVYVHKVNSNVSLDIVMLTLEYVFGEVLQNGFQIKQRVLNRLN